jgi:threo-3-hydroxy-L-aspartate ammonia-lyase
VTAGTSTLVSAADIDAAARALDGVAIRTPLLPASFLGDDIWLKPEMLQRGGAFKLRGAYNFLQHLDPSVRARGVVAPSSGNHAQAVALAAKLFGVPAIVVMPTTVTPAKRGGAERLGARVELAGTTTADRMERALEIARTEGATLVPPYDDALIIAGQGTVGLEIVQDLPEVATVFVPVGGGGLSAGVAAAVKLHRPKARVVGVEPSGAPKLSRARTAGAPVRLDRTSSIADGLLAVEIGHLTFAHHQRYVDDVVLVDDAAMRRAMRALLDRAKLVAEPSGAITVAAVMERAIEFPTPAVLVLSGGNIEWDGLASTMG